MGILISLRGDGPWRGKTTLNVNDRGDRHQAKIINGYVSSNGNEIRQRPGWHTILDLTEENNSNGYHRRIVDMHHPVYDWSISDNSYQYPASSQTTTLISWANLKHLHCMEQVRGRLLIIGESGFRKNPIYSSSRQEVTVKSIRENSQNWLITTSPHVGTPTITDASGAGQNGIAAGDTIYVNIDINSGPYTPYASELSNKFHCVKVRSNGPDDIRILRSGPAINGAEWTPEGDCEIFKTRSNASSVYPVSPYETNKYYQIDDPDALTVWTVVSPLDLDNPASLKAQPAWVANRQRDCGDDIGAIGTFNPGFKEGVRAETGLYSPSLIGGTENDSSRGISRRRQKSLPYRTNPDVAANRLVLAAPGYSCLFQCPIIIPTSAESWPSPSEWTENSGEGVIQPFNDLADKPRSLGLPKPILVDSVYNTTPNTATSPSIPWTPPYNHHLVKVAAASSPYSFPSGTYRFCITYYDDFTGEESLASEEVTVSVPPKNLADTGYAIQLTYIHPGYWFSETLCTSINVYMATNNQEPCAFYKRFPLRSSITLTTPTQSGKYGFPITYFSTPSGPGAQLYGFLRIPVPINTSPISAARDTTRLAPQSLQMPRGAECFRYIRGIGLSGGNQGSHGKAGELKFARASAIYKPTSTPQLMDDTNQIHIRGAATPSVETTPQATPFDGNFGLATNYFPPAYTGVGIYSQSLYPAPRQLAYVSRMLNSVTSNYFGQTTTATFDVAQAHMQRIQLDENIFDQDVASSTTGLGSPTQQSRKNKPIYMIEPKGQVLVSEPGRPEVAIGAAIQILDPNKDDDIVAIGQYSGGAIICSRRETYTLNWNRAPQGQTPLLVTNEHGCVATNSMVEFDGGLAWIGERGPVALTGNGFEWIGMDLEKDFIGSRRRYLYDSRGMMRHTWSCHDQQRGLIYWGMVTSDSTHKINYKGQEKTFVQHDDMGKSRFPCNEILVYSYRTGAWSVWTQPSGLEVYWMRPLKDKNGDTRVCFLAADGRVYALDEEWQDTNRSIFTSLPNSSGAGFNLSLQALWVADGGAGAASARGTGENLLRIGMPVTQLASDGTIKAETTIVSLASNVIQLANSLNWAATDIFEIGRRPELTIETSFIGDAPDNMDVSNVQVRYSLQGKNSETCYAKVTALNSDLRTAPTLLNYTNEPEWQPLGEASIDGHGSRRIFNEGRATGPEVSFKVVMKGSAHVRVTDILLEVS